MKFRRRAPGLLVVATAIVVFSIAGIADLLTTRMLDASKANSFKLMRDVLTSIIKSTEDRAATRAEVVSAMQSVRAAFIARDRAKLLAECEEMFHEQDEKYGLDQAQFHTPPGISFLRLHDPKKFGDDQSGYRPMLADVHANQALRKGVAITKAGPAVTGIVPMLDDAGKFVGSFEMGLEFAPMLDKIKEAYNIEASVFIDEKMLREMAGEAEAAALNPKNRVGRFMRYHSTNPALAAALVTHAEVEVAEPKSYERAFSGTAWGVQLVPMYNYAGKQIGVYALAQNLGESKSAAMRTRIWLLLATLFSLVFMVGMIFAITRGLLIAPLDALNQRMKALRDGDASQPADPMDSYCEELHEYAQHYERLRSEKRGGDS